MIRPETPIDVRAITRFRNSGDPVRAFNLAPPELPPAAAIPTTTNPVTFTVPWITSGFGMAALRLTYYGKWEAEIAVRRSNGDLLLICNNQDDLHGGHKNATGGFLPLPHAAGEQWNIECHYKEGVWRPDLPWHAATAALDPNALAHLAFGWWYPEQRPNVPPDATDGWMVVGQISPV